MPLHDLNLVMIRRNRHKAEKRGRLSNRLKPTGFTLLLLFSILLAGGLIAAAAVYVNVTQNLPSVEQAAIFFDPENGLILQPSRLYDRTGQTELLTLDNPAQYAPTSGWIPTGTHISPRCWLNQLFP